MNEKDLEQIEQLNAEIAEYLSEIQSLTDEVIELKIEIQQLKNQGNNVCCDDN